MKHTALPQILRRAAALALAAALAGACTSQGAVDWSYGGPGNGIVFARQFERQTGSKPRTGAAFAQAELRFSFGRMSAFAQSLALDFDSLHPYGYYLVKRGGDVLFAGKTAKGDSYAAADFLKRFTGYREFGGATGDLAGYFVQVCELACLFAVVLAEKIGGLL